MKGMKKLLSILMVLTLVLSLGATAFAVDITVDEKNDDGVGEYNAYRLFDLTTTATALPNRTGYSYTVNEKYASILYDVANLEGDDATNENLLDYISTLNGDAEATRTFADAVYDAIQEAEMEPDAKAVKGVFSGVPQGYYLIEEVGAVGGVTSQVILDTAGRDDVTVTTKEEKPSSEKKVQEKNDSTGDTTGWQDAADYDIGDHVPFQLTGTLPGDYETYDDYKVVFHDTESTGLTFDGESTVSVVCGSVTIPHDQFADNGIKVIKPTTDNHSFDIEITDVKTTFPDAKNSDVIYVYYTSTLNDGCVVGIPGNDNKMYMEYSNDHYSDGTGTTPEDVVTVFTFKLDVNKVQPDIDGDGENDPLAGAAFTLYKLVPFTSIEPGDTYVAIDGDTDNVLLQIEAKTAGTASTFNFSGLDSGEYVLRETATPAGFNSIDDIEFTVTATYDGIADDPQLKDLVVTTESKTTTFTVTTDTLGSATGGITTDVLNQTGVELPETGGIGTTIFYIAGAVLAAGAVILLVTKKRLSGNAEK